MRTRPISAEIAGIDTTAPAGVSYSGARVEGSYIILRYQSSREYCDRYYSDGKEVMRATGEIIPSFWQRVFGSR
jgi:hypothetical protein